MWNLDANSAFDIGLWKTMEELDIVVRSQDLPDADF
jgi:hypothetical protein